ncbi:MAG: hypothetical protein LBD77_04805 [Bifidobacteriaceae bacterium]|nr:hypothetical protein [Bifidobacteriaceae bacterium]
MTRRERSAIKSLAVDEPARMAAEAATDNSASRAPFAPLSTKPQAAQRPEVRTAPQWGHLSHAVNQLDGWGVVAMAQV